MEKISIELLEPRRLLSASWFVSPTGLDQNPGTLSAPFKTIQAAADAAQAGDFVEIEAGTYHETVTPANSGTSGSPITFEAYKSQKVIITGADPITGWTKYSGSIYKAPMPWDLLTGANQVFFDGVEGQESRWPNAPLGNLSHPPTVAMQSVKIISPGTAIIYNSSLSQKAGFWKGATVHMNPGQAWTDQTATITASSPGSITISYLPGGPYAIPTAGNRFYIWGTLNALDAGGEWYFIPSPIIANPGVYNPGTLYVKMPGGESPVNHDVEAKQRVYAFDVSSVHDITIQNLSLRACTIRTTSLSNDIIVNRVNARYLSETRLAATGGWLSPTDGIFMRGANCIVENCTIAYTSGDGIVFSGIGGTIENNVVHDADYVGTESAGIRAMIPNVLIDHNTVYNCGRHGIALNDTGDIATYNLVHDIGLQTTEAGGIHSVGNASTGGTIAFNDIYNIHTAGYGGTAIFLDNGSSGWTVHNNITSNVDHGFKLNNTSNNNIIYNNTLGATINSIDSNQLGNWDGVEIYNNIFLKPIVTTVGALITNNVTSLTTNPAYGAGSFAVGASGVPS